MADNKLILPLAVVGTGAALYLTRKKAQMPPAPENEPVVEPQPQPQQPGEPPVQIPEQPPEQTSETGPSQIPPWETDYEVQSPSWEEAYRVEDWQESKPKAEPEVEPEIKEVKAKIEPIFFCF